MQRLPWTVIAAGCLMIVAGQWPVLADVLSMRRCDKQPQVFNPWCLCETPNGGFSCQAATADPFLYICDVHPTLTCTRTLNVPCGKKLVCPQPCSASTYQNCMEVHAENCNLSYNKCN